MRRFSDKLELCIFPDSNIAFMLTCDSMCNIDNI